MKEGYMEHDKLIHVPIGLSASHATALALRKIVIANSTVGVVTMLGSDTEILGSTYLIYRIDGNSRNVQCYFQGYINRIKNALRERGTVKELMTSGSPWVRLLMVIKNELIWREDPHVLSVTATIKTCGFVRDPRRFLMAE